MNKTIIETQNLNFSYVFDLTSGASIIAVAGIGFLIALCIERFRPKIAVKSIQ